MKGEYVADVFSGCGGVARAVRQSGVNAREWERLHNDHFDLSRLCVARQIEEDARRGKLIATMLAPPCGSFSAISRYAHQTRNDPWATSVTHETEYMRCSVAAGNKCMRAAFRLIRLLERHQVPWILEHPRSSRAWWIPTLVHLEQQSHITKTVLHQCQS